MLSDEEKRTIENLKTEYEKLIKEDNILFPLYKSDAKRLINLIQKQSKEIEELKENNKLLQENYSSAHEDINWFCENYISKEESEQKERKAYIKGINDADELCNKKWEDKIKAKIEPRLKELDEQMKKEWKEYGNSREYQDMEDEWNFLQSLLEKE